MKTEDDSESKGFSLKKKTILIIIGSFILCLIAFLYFFHKDTDEDIESIAEDALSRDIEYDEQSGVFTTQGVDVVIDESAVAASGDAASESGMKKIYLTFDDGPSKYTDTILDILSKHNVKATFFVNAKEGEAAEAAYRRIVEDGHTLAMHSYNHVYADVYASTETFRADTRKLQEFLYSITGYWSRYYRFPGGSSNRVSKIPMKEFVECLKEDGITYFDWNIMSGDAVKGGLSTETIVRNCTKDIDRFDECMILMHDAASRYTTVEALEPIIEFFEQRGDCVILPISDDTVPIQHILREK